MRTQPRIENWNIHSWVEIWERNWKGDIHSTFRFLHLNRLWKKEVTLMELIHTIRNTLNSLSTSWICGKHSEAIIFNFLDYFSLHAFMLSCSILSEEELGIEACEYNEKKYLIKLIDWFSHKKPFFHPFHFAFPIYRVCEYQHFWQRIPVPSLLSFWNSEFWVVCCSWLYISFLSSARRLFFFQERNASSSLRRIWTWEHPRKLFDEFSNPFFNREIYFRLHLVPKKSSLKNWNLTFFLRNFTLFWNFLIIDKRLKWDEISTSCSAWWNESGWERERERAKSISNWLNSSMRNLFAQVRP